MNCNILNNYRPGSNLTFLYRNKYLDNNNHNESIESAYNNGHSTETALVRVNFVIMMLIDQGKPVIVALIDLSAALDLVGHNVPFSRLMDILSLSFKVLEWFRPYLEQRSYRVTVRDILY